MDFLSKLETKPLPEKNEIHEIRFLSIVQEVPKKQDKFILDKTKESQNKNRELFLKNIKEKNAILVKQKQKRNPDFIERNPDFIERNPDFIETILINRPLEKELVETLDIPDFINPQPEPIINDQLLENTDLVVPELEPIINNQLLENTDLVVPELEPIQPIEDEDINTDLEILEKNNPPEYEEEDIFKELKTNQAAAENENVILATKSAPVTKKKGRPSKKALANNAQDISTEDITNTDLDLVTRLPVEKEKIIMKAPTYYMNNRKLFVEKMSSLLFKYKDELIETGDTASCGQKQTDDFNLMTHQKIVRDYLNLYTPYRGILLYYGLGTGKTCTSIAIAEGMKSNKRVFIMTPASLKTNFFSEMKKCGDELYRKNQYWEFVSIQGKPHYVGILSRALSLSMEYIRDRNGAWLVNVTKPPNFATLSTEEKNDIDAQLDKMIRSKYKDINYNGLNMNKLNLLTNGNSVNPFDNSVVIIDEAHNFVSRIIGNIKKPKSISFILYQLLLKAENAKIVLLSGTPIINYPNEIGVLFNLLRGVIRTWSFRLESRTGQALSTSHIVGLFESADFKTYDYVEFKDNTLTITRNPFGFINSKKRGIHKGTTRQPAKAKGGKTKKTRRNGVAAATIRSSIKSKRATKKQHGGSPDVLQHYDGLRLNDSGNISDADFVSTVVDILQRNNIQVLDKGIVDEYKALPDNKEEFIDMFIDTEMNEAKNLNVLKKRILGLTSYFKSANEQLLPDYVKTIHGSVYNIVKCDMSIHQYGIYSKIRKIEADKEKKSKTMKAMNPDKTTRAMNPNKNELDKVSSTYCVFSRAACNFVFPEEIERPLPKIIENQEMDEDEYDAVPVNMRETADFNNDIDENGVETSYVKRIENAMMRINTKNVDGKSRYLDISVLDTLSPKFKHIVENLSDSVNQGLHLIYSHFRTIEGIGMLRLVLLANGYVEFKIKKTDVQWEIQNYDPTDTRPRFVLYTGTETAEEKEIIRNVYNSAWELVPFSIASRLKELHENNHMGQIIKIFMITASGAEGINLKNTRFVHIVEPYWHMVRMEQVIGRARRICSHEDLPLALRDVKVFLYMSTLSDLQRTDEKNIELTIRDVSKIDGKTVVTTDEKLFEMATRKHNINQQILRAIKETAIDCNLYSSLAGNQEESLVCYGYGKVESNQFGSYPSFEQDLAEREDLNTKKRQMELKKVTIKGVVYAIDKKTGEYYDYDSYLMAQKNPMHQLILVGVLKR